LWDEEDVKRVWGNPLIAGKKRKKRNSNQKLIFYLVDRKFSRLSKPN
jgi:hypothetical protein